MDNRVMFFSMLHIFTQIYKILQWTQHQQRLLKIGTRWGHSLWHARLWRHWASNLPHVGPQSSAVITSKVGMKASFVGLIAMSLHLVNFNHFIKKNIYKLFTSFKKEITSELLKNEYCFSVLRPYLKSHSFVHSTKSYYTYPRLPQAHKAPARPPLYARITNISHCTNL